MNECYEFYSSDNVAHHFVSMVTILMENNFTYNTNKTVKIQTVFSIIHADSIINLKH